MDDLIHLCLNLHIWIHILKVWGDIINWFWLIGELSCSFISLNLFTLKYLNLLWQTILCFFLFIFFHFRKQMVKNHAISTVLCLPRRYSFCLIIPIFFNQVCTPTNWLDEWVMEILPDTCMPLVWPILFLLGPASFDWPPRTRLCSLASQVLQNPVAFGRQNISLEIESHTLWADTFPPLISCLEISCSLTFTVKEKPGDKIILTFPKGKPWSLMSQQSEWLSLALASLP